MKKIKTKDKAAPKEAGSGGNRGQVVKLKTRPKAKRSWSFKLPPVVQYWHTVKQFVAEAWQELKKVTWPNRKETLGTTSIVLILVIIVAVFLGLVDYGLSRLVRIIVY